MSVWNRRSRACVKETGVAYTCFSVKSLLFSSVLLRLGCSLKSWPHISSLH